MKNNTCKSIGALIVAAWLANTTVAVPPTIDGSTAGDGYGAALSVQTVNTQFGDANPLGGSELDAAYGRIEGGRLYLTLTGNMETNFNKLNIFIDSKPGGQNQLNLTNPTNDGWAVKYNGFRFDAGFAADYMLTFRCGFSGFDRCDIDYAIIGGAAADGGTVGSFPQVLGTGTGLNLNANIGAAGNVAMDVSMNNSNVAGVVAGIGAANQAAAAAVLTGLELAIDLEDLGFPAGDIKISAHINGSNHDYLSNQFLAGLPAPQGNLGGDGDGTFNGTVGQIDLANGISPQGREYSLGLQYFTVPIPEPTTLSLAALAGLGLLRRRRARVEV